MLQTIVIVTVLLVVGERPSAGAFLAPANACALLTTADIEAVLGESVKERKPASQSTGGLLTSQCFFATSSARSISLTLTVTNAASRSRLTAREYWRRQFHSADHDRDEDKPARPIGGVGDEAYWTGNRFAGALYVLRGETFLRISVGGIGDEQERIGKSKALALAAIKRLSR